MAVTPGHIHNLEVLFRRGNITKNQDVELSLSILSSYLFCKLSSEFSEAVASVGNYPQDDTAPSSSQV